MNIKEFIATQEDAALVEIINDPLANPLIMHKIGPVKLVASTGIRLAVIMHEIKQDSKFYLIGLNGMSYLEQEDLNEASQSTQLKWFKGHVNKNATIDIIDELNLNIM